jgi:signal transduction histidine kinase
MKTRNWSIRSKIIAMITVPLAALLALWIFATTLSAGPAFSLLSARALADSVANRGAAIGSELQRERRLSVQFVADPGGTTVQLNQQRQVTDRVIGAFRAAGQDGDWDGASDVLRSRIDQVLTDLAVLPAQRLHIDRRELDMIGAQNIYNGMLSTLFSMFSATATFPEEEINRQVRALSTVGRGQEYLSRTDSLLAAATVHGAFTDELRSALMQDVGTARFLLRQGVEDMPAASRAAYERLSRGEAFKELDGMMDRLIVESRPGVISPVGADTWHPAYVRSAQQLREFENDAIDALADRGASLAIDILIRLLLAGLLGLVALIVALVVSLRVGRSMVGRLRRLRGEALEMATARLPNVVRRLQRGENVDVDVETPPLEYGLDEIGELGQAFNDVQRTAVRSAVEEANIRRGLNEVFLNIARRSQTLLHRQLALLDRMERRETEPDELEDLYRVDHLATRMRRHAEDLVILAGAAPGRGWRHPVPVIDVVRGAISEVEDYKRVDIRAVDSSAVLGRAVGDVIHLLAELLENAASYSPPHTRVQITGQILPNGYAIEIEDRGLGMTHEALDEANRSLVEPPEFDPADSARLGLFVVAQLANRHAIRVSLRASAFGGITAIVLLPGELVVAGPVQAALPAGPAADGTRPFLGTGPQERGRHSIAALQWQDSEELRHVPVEGRGSAPNGAAISEARHAQPRGGPVPLSVPDGLSVDGLVQRRRVHRPVDLGTADEAVAAARTTQPALPAAPTPASAAPVSAAPVSAAPAEAAGEQTTLEGLPRRVRQANLVPQLRRPAGPLPDEPTVRLRPPDQARSLMSALQQGTARGRIEASRIHHSGDNGQHSPFEDRLNAEEPGKLGSSRGDSFDDAATVIFPAIANLATDGDEAANRVAADAASDRATTTGNDHVTRPDKDA